MGVIVTTGASVMCTFGTAPASLTVTSQNTILGEGKPVATIGDTTISTCGMCSSLGNPQVASATAAALGVLTPQPCVPVFAGSWIPGGTGILAGGKPCLTNEGRGMCAYGGSLSIVNPGQSRVITG